jgi:hypothetical protein
MRDGTFGVKGRFGWSDDLTVAAANDGRVFWIGGHAGLARLSSDGKVSEHRQFNRAIAGIAMASDWSLWFTAPVDPTEIEGVGDAPDFIGHRTQGGRISLFPVGSHSPYPRGLAVVDGVVWFSERHGLGRIDASGHHKSFRDPTEHAFATDLIAAQDGSLWLVDSVHEGATLNVNRLVHFRPPATFNVYDVPDEPVAPTGVSHPVEDGDGTIWISLHTEPRVVALHLGDKRTRCHKMQHSVATRSPSYASVAIIAALIGGAVERAVHVG